jgi:hypothetical protein
MATEKQPEGTSEEVVAPGNDWFQQLLKHIELHLPDAGRELTPGSDVSEFQATALRAVYQTLLDSGMQPEAIASLFGTTIIWGREKNTTVEWTPELSQRRFELIDRQIQGTIKPEESVELAGLTQMMRDNVDTEANLPIQGARDLHRRLLDGEAEQQ